MLIPVGSVLLVIESKRMKKLVKREAPRMTKRSQRNILWIVACHADVGPAAVAINDAYRFIELLVELINFLDLDAEVGFLVEPIYVGEDLFADLPRA
jgi:hypothetical protein